MDKLKSVKTKQGNEICLLGNSPHGKTLVIGVFHGDEPQGKFLIEEYIKKIDKSFSHNKKCQNCLNDGNISNYPPLASKQELCSDSNLLFIPCLNPDGMNAGTRTNSNGVDLNRNFPTKNWVLGERTITETGEKNLFFGGNEPASEIETQFLIDTIEEYKPDTILTLHAPYKVVNYDGPAKDIAQMISDIMYYPVEESIGYPTPGSFGTYAGIERNIKTITLELDEICPVEELISPVHRVFDKLS